jgi:hypothetical protein
VIGNATKKKNQKKDATKGLNFQPKERKALFSKKKNAQNFKQLLLKHSFLFSQISKNNKGTKKSEPRSIHHWHQIHKKK